jgi:ankyrin repeat protein
MQEKRLQNNIPAKAPAKPKAGIIESQKKALSEKKQKQLNGMLLDAAGNGKTKRAERLLNVGASIDVKDNDGWTPLTRAVENKNTEIAQLLAEAGARALLGKEPGRLFVSLLRECTGQ